MRDNDGALVYAAAATRWVGTGRAIFDSKGQPIKQYEPYFSSVPDFDDEDELVRGELEHADFRDTPSASVIDS